MFVGKNNKISILIPAGVVHAYRSISKNGSFSINLPNKLYAGKHKKEKIDEIRYEDESDSRFTRKFKIKILITGSKGMLGSDLAVEFRKTNNEIIGCSKEEIDITNKQHIKKIEKINPKVIINCAAYTNVDLAEKEREKCYSVNTLGVKNLVEFCEHRDVILVQISTDYVFDGNKKGYNENDKKNPINFYGKTKSKAEDIIIKKLKKYYIIRTSWLFGKNGKNFVKTIIQLSKKKKKIDVVDDQIGSPTYTKDLSQKIVELIMNKNKYGIYHLTNSGMCSWFEFAKNIAELYHLQCKIDSITSNEKIKRAMRPKFSILNNNKTSKLRDWKKALASFSKNKE